MTFYSGLNKNEKKLFDKFAGKALARLSSNNPVEFSDKLASHAYILAREMILQRRKIINLDNFIY